MKKTTALISVLLAVLLIGAVALGGCTAADGTDPTSLWTMVIFLVLLFAVFWFLIIRPQRKRQQDQKDLLSNLRPGDKVVTIGGIYGQVESLSETSIILKVESGTMIRLARRSIAYKQDQMV
ncbi:MAG: preprotein translocase subunit YajC [Dehalococcoidales bacterium]|nr:preprotein translocase subunit YajC [Dehalococcoidales bacterium]